MTRMGKSVWALLMAQCLSLAAVGCFSGNGFTRALADDLAFTVAAATQGLLTGAFTQNDPP